VTVYDGLAGPAMRHVLATIARFVDCPQHGIATHTVEELLVGIDPGSRPAEMTATDSTPADVTATAHPPAPAGG